MYFFFVIKETFVRLLSIIAYPMSKINPTFGIFCIWLYIGIYNTFIFVSNGDSLDWKGLSGDEMNSRIIEKTMSGSIILFHNDTKHTAESLDMILKNLKEAGFSFVKGSELIYNDNFVIDHTGKQIRA